MQILLATNNQHKRDEFSRILDGFDVVTPADLGVEFSHHEDGSSFADNAMGKARALRSALLAGRRAAAAPLPVILADDSGICVAALGGGPGIYSARFGSPDGGRTELPAAARNQLLLDSLRTATDRDARFVCCLAALVDGERFIVAQESWEGVIAHAPSGGGGFGYDPVFYLPGRGRTAAELSPEEKDRLSHRGRAATVLVAALRASASLNGHGG